MTIKYLSDAQVLKYVIELQNLKDAWLEKLDACALDREKTLDDVLLMLLDGIRVICKNETATSDAQVPFHVRLYEVRPLNSASIRALRAMREKGPAGGPGYHLDVMLYLKFDTFTGLDSNRIDMPEEQRYFPILNGTVTGDVFMGEMPVVCVERPLELPDSEVVGDVHYGVYKDCRLSRSHNRAAFPVINRRTKEVEYVVVIAKKDALLNQHEIRYVRNLLARAHEAILIKDLENRAHLHDAYFKRRLHDLNNLFQMIQTNIGLALDLVPDSDNPPVRLKSALVDAKKNFDILTEHLKGSGERHNYYDMRAHAVGALISAKLKSYERYDFYKGHLKFTCRFDSPDSLVLVDKKAFYLALDNMTKNTFEALKEPDGSVLDGKTAEVVVETEQKGQNIVIRYFDDCGGMDPILYDSVMRRGACKTTKEGGSGFGVASILSTFRDTGYLIDPVNKPGVGFGYEITMKIESDPGRHVYMDITTGQTVGN